MGAIHVILIAMHLTLKEFSKVTRVKGETTEEIEENLLKENIVNIDVEERRFNGQ